MSYYQKLSFVDQLDSNDLDKMFNYNDLYPSLNELKEAKENVLKCKNLLKKIVNWKRLFFNFKILFKDYKKKNASNIFPRNIVFDIIYYIYPPQATKLKTTRKSTWLNPTVGQEDALRLRGLNHFMLHIKFFPFYKPCLWNPSD